MRPSLYRLRQLKFDFGFWGALQARGGGTGAASSDSENGGGGDMSIPSPNSKLGHADKYL